MTIHLPADLAEFIHDAVRAGRYEREDDVIRDAVSRLRQALQEAEAADSGGETSRQGKPLTKQELHRHLTAIGLMDQAPATTADPVPPADELIDAEGDIVSERVIRERLIEWLAGFL